MKDYSQAELDALDVLERGSIMDGWCGFPTCPVDDVLRRMDPDLAARSEVIDRRNARLRSACASLHKRGLVERRRCPLDGRWFDYRLIEMLRVTGSAPEERRQIEDA